MGARPWTTAAGDNPAPPAPNAWPCKSQPGGCLCRCHAIVTAKATDKTRQRNYWSAKEDDAIRRMLASGETLTAIADAVSQISGRHRTVPALKNRIVRLGISSRENWFTRTDLCYRLGVSPATFVGWVQVGLIEETRYGRWQRYSPEHVEAFVKAHAGVVLNPRFVKDRHLRSLAETSAIANRRRQSA